MSEISDEVSVCPECGSSEFESLPEDDLDDYACAKCGYVIDSKTDLSETSSEAGGNTQKNLRDEETTASKLSKSSDPEGWNRWYPCPKCGSTMFEQTETLTVYGSHDGNYNGDDNDFTELIKCAECGANLTSI